MYMRVELQRELDGENPSSKLYADVGVHADINVFCNT